MDTGSLRGANDGSGYWSATPYPGAISAYFLYFNIIDVHPSVYYSRFYGFSVRGGGINLNTGSLRNADYDSYYWSATTYPNTTYAYGPYFYSTGIYPSNYDYNRYYGFSAYCK